MKELIAIHRIERKSAKGKLEYIEPRHKFTANEEDAKRYIETGVARDPNAPKKSTARTVRVNATRAEETLPVTEAAEKGGKETK